MIYEMILKGYRVYKYSGQPTKRMFIEMVKLIEFPTLIFVKNKKLEF